METKNCQNCKKDFTIDPEDFDFYKKIKVPPPTWCSECRAIRRMLFNNVWSIYKRNCAKCGNSTLSIYSEDKPFIVYCMPCWWGDTWDGSEYGTDYDPSKPFLQQLKELELKTPWQTLTNMYLQHVNSDYVNANGPVKNCYLTFWADYCEDVLYSSYLNGLKVSSDCYRMKDCELCYEGVGLHKCYRTFFSEELDSCTDTWFSRSCSGLVNCFGCINLRNKSYCIFNEQYSKEAYFEKIKEFNLDSRDALDEMRKKVIEFWNKYPRRYYIGHSMNVNVTGDYIYGSKNVKDSYMVTGAEDCKYVQFLSVAKTTDSYDYYGWGDGADRIYESSVVGFGASNVKFSDECWPNAMNIEYSIYAVNACKDCFGCVNLKKKQYCILNKQYTKEEYEKLKAQIISDMDINPYIDQQGRVWKYGEFLPVDLAPFAYNESNAGKFYPKTKEEALSQGFKWHDEQVTKHTITKKAQEIPDTLAEISSDIVKEVIECSTCGKAYRFVPNELSLMQKLGLPLPRQCHNCRQNFRFSRTNLPKLYDRNCMKCGKDIKTSYAPDRPEIVYCESCYQQEVN